MKRKDIKAGVIYGQDGYNGGPRPLLFIDGAQTLWRLDSQLRRLPADPKHFRAGRADSCGYVAVTARDPEFLRMLDPAALMERWRNGGEPPAGACFELVTVMAEVPGEYGEARAAWEARREQERAGAVRREREFRDRIRRMDAVASGLREAGLPSARDERVPGDSRVSITIGDAERLLSLLRERHEANVKEGRQ